MKNVGLIGWRGLVGSVLLKRMEEEGDLKEFHPVFFSTGQVGSIGPLAGGELPLEDAYSLESLKKMDVLLTCWGDAYSKRVHCSLRSAGWRGLWLDAASTLRLQSNSLLILDPLNQKQLEEGLAGGIRDFIGANCTVSLMLMGLAGLFQNHLVEWVSSMTYQAASGAGALPMMEFLKQMGSLGEGVGEGEETAQKILAIDCEVRERWSDPYFPKKFFGTPLAGSFIPWIDEAMPHGQTREEWKGQVEANKLLGTSPLIPIDGLCVRVGAMRSHGMALTIKLKKKAPLDEVEEILAKAHPWVKLISNNREETLKGLSPVATSGTLDIAVGRVRKFTLGDEYLGVFTVGDQLLWGAAEPLRRMLRLCLEFLSSH